MEVELSRLPDLTSARREVSRQDTMRRDAANSAFGRMRGGRDAFRAALLLAALAPGSALVAPHADYGPLQRRAASRCVRLRPLRRSAPRMAADAAELADLTESEARTVSVFRRVSPSVANVQTTQLVPLGFALRPTEYPAGSGSGFVWDAEGHIVTNYHVISSGGGRAGSRAPPKRVKVSLQGRAQPVDAAVVGFDEDRDLAVLKIDAGWSHEAGPAEVDGEEEPGVQPGLQPVELGSSSSLLVGQTVVPTPRNRTHGLAGPSPPPSRPPRPSLPPQLAIGNPFGLDYSLSVGVVSALGREVGGYGGARPLSGCVQTDAAINPGNSGGPLLDSRGRLVGVNTAILSPGGGAAGNVGIGFAVPVDTVRRVVTQIIKYGADRSGLPTLGANVMDDGLRRAYAASLRRPLEGALLVEVVPGGPAAVAGLRPCTRGAFGEAELGDLITSVDGQPVRQSSVGRAPLRLYAESPPPTVWQVRSNEDLLAAVEDSSPTASLALGVRRGCDPNAEGPVTVRLVTRGALRDASGGRGGRYFDAASARPR